MVFVGVDIAYEAYDGCNWGLVLLQDDARHISVVNQRASTAAVYSPHFLLFQCLPIVSKLFAVWGDRHTSNEI
jgi:deoxyinosine 3'endonuclease (endonuclease V)